MRLSARGTVKSHVSPYWFGVGKPMQIVNWSASPGGTRHRTTKFIYQKWRGYDCSSLRNR
ncbi:hypothetical protein CAE12_002121 [Salmonella enterica subsp. enterica serovar Stanley]|nr:hypothetical protein [Salmonella enterica]EGX2061822.1 hypothetical protein [Salmonella enterica subsp. enterica serovar Stanley]